MSQRSKSRTKRTRASSPWQQLALLSVLLGACGVAEHPHAQQAINGKGDFGPEGGATGTPAQAGAPATATAGSTNQAGDSFGGGPNFGQAGFVSGAGRPAVAGNGSVSSGGANGVAGATATGTSGAPGAAGAPTSGVTINLGGVEVPKERAIAFIHVGHSNMAGRATSPSASRPYHFTQTDPHAYMYHVGMSPALAIEPKTAGDTAAAGPGTALVKEAAALAPNTYFISLGFGYPSAYCSQFVPGGLYYDKLIAAPKNIKGRVTFGAIFIYLGITERHAMAGEVENFPNCINTLVTAIRNDVGEPNLPFLMNDYEVEGSGEFKVGGEVETAIHPQIAKVPSTVSNSALVSAAGIGMQDDHHFNLDGHRTWAQRALMTMKQKNWFPWQ